MFQFTDSQSKIIKSLYNNKQLSDAQISIDGDKTIYVHKFLLCVSSEYARSIFMSNREFKETQSGIMDLSGYDPRVVKICIRSLYDFDIATTKAKTLIDDIPNKFGELLDLAMYLGLHKLQILLESIGCDIFESIWTDKMCRIYLANALLTNLGQKKKKIANLFVKRFKICYENKQQSQDDIEFIDFMYNLDANQLERITKLGASGSVEQTIAFILWTQWYVNHGNAKDQFDLAISKGSVNIRQIRAEHVLDCIISIKKTLTYNWIMQQFPELSRIIINTMKESQMKKSQT